MCKDLAKEDADDGGEQLDKRLFQMVWAGSSWRVLCIISSRNRK